MDDRLLVVVAFRVSVAPLAMVQSVQLADN